MRGSVRRLDPPPGKAAIESGYRSHSCGRRFAPAATPLPIRPRGCDLDSTHPSCRYKKYGGRDEDNFVNELPASGRGLQLEQTSTARKTYGSALARGVNPATTSMSVDDTGLNLSTGPCPYFVGELAVLHGAAQRWAWRTSVSCGTGSCTGLIGRAGIYTDNADGT